MKKLILSLLTLVYFSIIGVSQEKEVFGYIFDFASKERMEGVIVKDTISGAQCVTDKFGYYSLKSEGDVKYLFISHLGYKDQLQEVKVKKLTEQQDFSLI